MTVKEFYRWCKEKSIDNYELDCYGGEADGYFAHRSSVVPSSILIDDDDKSIVLWTD